MATRRPTTGATGPSTSTSTAAWSTTSATSPPMLRVTTDSEVDPVPQPLGEPPDCIVKSCPVSYKNNSAELVQFSNFCKYQQILCCLAGTEEHLDDDSTDALAMLPDSVTPSNNKLDLGPARATSSSPPVKEVRICQLYSKGILNRLIYTFSETFESKQ